MYRPHLCVLSDGSSTGSGRARQGSRLLAGFLLLALCSWSSVAQAELSLFEGDEVELRAAASWRSASAVLWSPLAELVVDAGALGIAASGTRLELKADFGE
ncbi:MAG: hypothetical protein RBU37_04200, partial [Myxococcota bacterium]|nr:hypothetical protein [Myxococcota bacterium]